LLSSIICNEPSTKVKHLKIGLKNKMENMISNQMIYEINTNFLYLNISISNLNNIKIFQIVDRISSELNLDIKCPEFYKFCESK